MTKRMIVAVLVIALLPACALAQEVRLLNGFDTPDDLAKFRWGSKVKSELVAEHVTQGIRAVKVTFPGGEKYGGFGLREPAQMADWDKWDLIAFDVYNPSKEIRTLVIRIDDDRTDPSEYATWYTGTFKVFPGKNRIEIETAKLNKPHAGPLNTDKLKQLALWTGQTPEDKVLYFDDFGLRKFATATLPKTLSAFDFGAAGSNVQPGFTLATESTKYDDKRGYGFEGGALRSYEDAPRAAEALGKDSVGGASVRFAVKVPNGRYSVWAATGFIDSYNWPRKAYTVKVNDEVVFEHKPEGVDDMDAADPLAGDYSRKKDLWDVVVVGHLFDEFETDLRVDNGKIEIAIDGAGGGRLRGLAVWPVDDAAARNAMNGVHKARREAFHKQWREIAPPAPNPAPTLTEEFARGFALIKCNLLEDVTPYWRPKVDDRFTTLAIAATPGERAPAVFIVYPVKDIAECTVTVHPLKGPAGATIDPSRVEVNTVQYRYCRDSEDAYRVNLAHLVPRNTFAAETAVPRVVWMNVNVPADAKPGTYAGSVVVSGGALKIAGFVLTVEVHPFTLDRPEDHGIVYAHASRVREPAEKIEADLRCLAKYGCNSITPSGVIGGKMQDMGGKADYTFDRLDLLMSLMKKVGMTGPVPLFDQSIQGYAGGASRWHIGWQVLDEKSDWAANMTRLTRQILDRAKEKDYLPVLMYPSTEISNDPGLGPRMNSEIIKAIRAAGECRIISSVNRPEDVATAKELDHIMLNFGAGITQETIDRVHASGAKLWFQNVGQTRYVDGFFMLRTGAVGHRQWVANWPSADPYNDWDGADSNSMLFPSKTRDLPSIKLARMAEGVTDQRYFLTLRRHIAEARKAGLAALADAAQREMDAMLATCPVQLPDGTRVFEDGLSVIDGFSDPDTFDRYRQRAAAQIIALRGAMGR